MLPILIVALLISINFLFRFKLMLFCKWWWLTITGSRKLYYMVHDCDMVFADNRAISSELTLTHNTNMNRDHLPQRSQWPILMMLFVALTWICFGKFRVKINKFKLSMIVKGSFALLWNLKISSSHQKVLRRHSFDKTKDRDHNINYSKKNHFLLLFLKYR